MLIESRRHPDHYATIGVVFGRDDLFPAVDTRAVHLNGAPVDWLMTLDGELLLSGRSADGGTFYARAVDLPPEMEDRLIRAFVAPATRRDPKIDALVAAVATKSEHLAPAFAPEDAEVPGLRI
ncbi:hypothetical protein [Azospirillum argentinense]|uniref:hypothetical protein n=1 Tax=Azospirillum argentinense TaxID=2970906 RepID=UPI0032E022EB